MVNGPSAQVLPAWAALLRDAESFLAPGDFLATHLLTHLRGSQVETAHEVLNAQEGSHVQAVSLLFTVG